MGDVIRPYGPTPGERMFALGFLGPGPLPPIRPIKGRLHIRKIKLWWIAVALPLALMCAFVAADLIANDRCEFRRV
jgi:hypothetical protein